MKKMLVMFVVLAALIMPKTASAQYYGDPRVDQLRAAITGGYYGGRQGIYNRHYGGYGFYDPAYIQQMMSLPESLVACQVDFTTGHVVSCRPVVKEIGAIQAYLQNPEGMFGTVHVEKGKMHFRPFDDTNQRLGRGGATAIGTAGGAVAGAVFGGKKGAVIGGGVGALTGWLASRKFNRHDNCLVIEPTVAKSAGLSAGDETTPVTQPSQISDRSSSNDIADNLVDSRSSIDITWETMNNTDFRAIVTDPTTGEKKLIPAGGTLHLPDPVGDQPYTVVLLEPGRGKSNQVPAEIRPTENLQGWEIVARR